MVGRQATMHAIRTRQGPDIEAPPLGARTSASSTARGLLGDGAVIYRKVRRSRAEWDGPRSLGIAASVVHTVAAQVRRSAPCVPEVQEALLGETSAEFVPSWTSCPHDWSMDPS